MGIEVIETTEIEGIIYSIQRLDNKYTVYSKKVPEKGARNEENYSAVASFDDLQAAKTFIESQRSRKAAK